MKLERENTRTIKEVLDYYPPEQRYSLAVLQEVQKEYGYISPNNLLAISSHLGVPVSEIFSIATFYKALSLDKKGKCIIKVCDGTACHIRGSVNVLEEIKRALKINEGETTPDGLFSIEIVNCVGSCAMAPIVICNNEYFGNVQTGIATGIIEDARKEVTSHE
ncbi:MAG TPA: NAD(P)H-dependent oxidoreductase subunit E [Anaerovoracaceae bacterium]|nr:NAD(P)H-dependent oxidoreductase subunit E [Anaerovoracaceae bacterium]